MSNIFVKNITADILVSKTFVTKLSGCWVACTSVWESCSLWYFFALVYATHSNMMISTLASLQLQEKLGVFKFAFSRLWYYYSHLRKRILLLISFVWFFLAGFSHLRSPKALPNLQQCKYWAESQSQLVFSNDEKHGIIKKVLWFWALLTS